MGGSRDGVLMKDDRVFPDSNVWRILGEEGRGLGAVEVKTGLQIGCCFLSNELDVFMSRNDCQVVESKVACGQGQETSARVQGSFHRHHEGIAGVPHEKEGTEGGRKPEGNQVSRVTTWIES